MSNRPDDRLLWLGWLTRLRWVALIAQVITLGFSYRLIQPFWTLGVLFFVMVVLLAANLRALTLVTQRTQIGESTLLWQLGLDVIALTTFFFVAGGPENPFVILYLVHVAMGAFMLEPRRATVLSLVVLASYLGLHVRSQPLHFDNHSLPPHVLHTLGQIIAFMVTVPSVAIFIVGLATALRRRTTLLLDARERTSRTDRLRSVGTLAAGAAHELNTPLSTIGLRISRVGRRHQDEETARDLDVVQTQLKRCTRIVQQLLAGAGDPSAVGIETLPIGVLVSDSVKMWSTGSSLDAVIDDRSEEALVKLPRVAFSQALSNLLENAREAQQEAQITEPLQITVEREHDSVTVRVRDHGSGLPEEPEQVGTPFFTTKSTGTGLGVFVARQVADGAGGGLRYVNHSDGTTAHWWFPIIEAPDSRRRSASEER